MPHYAAISRTEKYSSRALSGGHSGCGEFNRCLADDFAEF
jgi:hypothetical protein